MAAFRDPRSRLVAIYVGLVALFYAIHALPGGMTYRGGAGEAVLWIVVDVILIAYIAKGSRVATAIPLVLNVFFLATYVTFGLGPDGIRMVDAVPLLVVAAQSIVLVLLLRRGRAVPSSRAAPAG